MVKRLRNSRRYCALGWGVLGALTFVGPAVHAEGSAQLGQIGANGTGGLRLETVLYVDVLPGDGYLNIAARGAAANLSVTVTDEQGTATTYAMGNAANGLLTTGTLPAQLPNGTTTPLSIAVTPGTYAVQFSGHVEPFDISVSADIPTQGNPIQTAAVPPEGGRLYSKDWRFFSDLPGNGAVTNDSDFFLRTPVGADSEYLWKLDFEGLLGGLMCLTASPLGLPGELARSSRTFAEVESVLGLANVDRYTLCPDLAEFPLYVNPPHDRKPRPQAPQVTFRGIGQCGAVLEGSGGTFEFESSLPATYELVIDVDHDDIFDPGTGDVVLSGAAVSGLNVATWDGKDTQGVDLPAAGSPYSARVFVRVGEFHFTASDVEGINPGVGVSLVAPDTLAESSVQLYWDDSRLDNATGTPANPIRSTPDGVTSPAQRHSWMGANIGGNVYNGPGEDSYIDTWVFGDQTSEDFVFTISLASADADGDGLVNGRECEIGSIFDDPDTDGDSVSDGAEAPATGTLPDTNDDGTADVFDVDDDGDGIPTAEEAPDANADQDPDDARDTDGNGVPDYLDPDDDGDGIPTAEESPDPNDDGNPDDAVDTNGDDTPNYLDPDDDGDGIPTVEENADPNEDGNPDDAVDTNGDDTPNYLDPDDDGDGIPTSEELTDAEDAGTDDADGDGDPNWLDPDSDDDGLPDGDEAVGDGDANDNGVPDYLEEPDAPPGTELDSDGDGVPDRVECTQQGACQDSDGDDTPDYLDTDDDGDGITTKKEDLDRDGDPTNDDSDGDGTPNYLDEDDDEDGIPTATEVTDAATFGDDVDGDGKKNWLDTDSDSDGIADGTEAMSGGDRNQNQVPDYLEPPNGSNPDAGVGPDGDAGTMGPCGAAPCVDGGAMPLPSASADAGAPPVNSEEPSAPAPSSTADELPVAGSLEGGGCQCRVDRAPSQGGAAHWALLGLLPAAFVLRRRRANGSRETRAGFSGAGFIGSAARWLGALLGGAVLSAPQPASAQQPGIALDRYEPSERGSEWFWGESLDLRGNGRVALGVVGDWAYKPLVSYDANGDELTAVIRHQVYGHVGAAVNVIDRLRFAASVPVLLYQAGDPVSFQGSRYDVKEGAGIGDVRLGVDVRLLGEYQDVATLVAGAQVYLPTGSRDAYTGDGKVRVVPRLMLAGGAGRLAYSARASIVLHSQRQDYAGQAFGSDLQLGGTLGLRFFDKRLLVGPEIWTSTVISDSGDGLFERRTTPLEGVLGAHLTAGDFRIGAGAGPGFTPAFGTPTLRVLCSVEWFPNVEEPPAPPPAPVDSDGDGITDERDACPLVAGVPSEDPSKHGCPVVRLDRDHDGIFDEDDACVDVPGVASEDPKRNGCPADRDGDGILDAQDACIDEPGVASPEPAKNGCPPPKDRDGDGILDEQDACPDKAGPASSEPEKNGCPRVEITKERVVILDRIEFDTDKDTIRPESNAILQAVFDVLKEGRELQLVQVEGYTDNRGSRAHNLDLSKRRAKAVVKWLVDHGIDATRLRSQGFGPDHPVDTNDTDVGRQNNRRVEFRIVEAAAGSGEPEKR